jgi:primosomal replication protein N
MQQKLAVCTHAGPSVKLPVLACPTCGLLDTTVMAPGRGPHVAALRCQAGHHIKWAPKALLERKAPMGSVNRVVLIGTVSKHGIEMRYSTSGAPCASFTLVLGEVGQDGKEYTTLVPCEVWGRKAEGVSELPAGQCVLFEGKVSRRRKGETWELLVSGFDVTPITAPLASMTGHSN